MNPKLIDAFNYLGFGQVAYDPKLQCGILRINNHRRRRNISITVVLAVFLVIVLWWTTFGQSGFVLDRHLPLLLFLLCSLVMFTALVTFCLRRLELHAHSIEMIRKHLSPDVLQRHYRELFTTLAHESPQNANQDTGDKKELPEQRFIRRLDVMFEQIEPERLPDFVKLKVLEYRHRLALCRLTPKSGYYHLSTEFAAFPAETQRRSLAQAFVTALLFIGIIGTFHGLIVTFEDRNIIELLDAYVNSGQGGFHLELGRVLSGFHEAFGSSLFAYVSFLLGRFMLDTLDDDHDALIDFVDERLRTITSAFAGIKVDTFVDLPESTKVVFENSAQSVSAAALRHAEMIERSESLIATYNKFGQQLLLAIGEARKDWKEASDVWGTTTTRFVASASHFSKRVQEVTNETQAALNSFNAHLDQSLQHMETLSGNIDTHVEEIRSYTAHFEETRALIRQFGEAMINANDELNRQVELLFAEEVKSRHAYNGQLNHMLDSATERVTESMDDSRTRQLEVLSRIDESLGRLSDSLAEQSRDGHGT